MSSNTSFSRKTLNPKAFHIKSTTIAIAAASAIGTLPVSAKTFTEALSTGKASVNVRLRYENVDDDAFADKAEAMTIRTRLGYETAPYYGFTALVEFEDIHALGGMDNYQLPAPPAPTATGDAVIADPEEDELNRVQLRYRGVSKLDLVLGRQRIIYDNQRFVGSVGFRQDEQTFDAFTAVYTGIADWTFNYAYIDRVNGITPVFDSNVNDTFVNVAYSGFTWAKFTAYSYLLSNQEESLRSPVTANVEVNPSLQFLNNDTYGLRLDGAYVLPTTASLKAIYRAEYARQSVDKMSASKAATATTALVPAAEKSFDAKYKLAELGMAYTFGGAAYTLTPLLGYESLGSDKGLYGLQTPYATKHAFQGWVDQFLVTPNEGLIDKYFSLGFDLNNYTTKILAMYHEYDSDEKSATTHKDIDFGNEWNLQVMKTIGANWIVGAKYGRYFDGDKVVATRKDANKAWAWVELNF